MNIKTEHSISLNEEELCHVIRAGIKALTGVVVDESSVSLDSRVATAGYGEMEYDTIVYSARVVWESE